MAGQRLGNEVRDLARVQGIGEVDDPEAAREPGEVNQRAVQLLAVLVGAEASARPTPGRVRFTDVEDVERLDVVQVGDVEDPHEAMQAAAPVLVLLVDGDRDPPSPDSMLQRHDGVGRLGKRRVVVVAADQPGPGDIGDVEDAEARVPDRGPELVAEHDYHPPFPEPTHTIIPLERPIDGRRIAVAVDEEHDHTPGLLHGFMWVFDVTDFDKIQPLSAFDVSEMDSPWSRAPGRFGAHQFREKMDGTLVYVTWFAGGLRIVDVADPFLPTEVAHFIPEPVNGEASPQSNDVDVDENGLIYLLDRNNGFDILERTG